MNQEEFLSELRDQLMEAAERSNLDGERDGPARRRTRRVLVLGAVAATIVVVVLGGLVWRGAPPAGADLDVIVKGDDVIVRLTDLETRPDEVVAAAREVGLDLSVTEVPVGPSNVGKFVEMTAVDGAAAFRPIHQIGSTFTGFRVRKGWPGTLSIALGRPARDGERWIAASDALAPGEPLECEPLLGKTVADVEETLGGRDLNVDWSMMPGPGDVTDLDDYRSWKVVQIDALGDDSLFITATVDGSSPFPIPLREFPDNC